MGDYDEGYEAGYEEGVVEGRNDAVPPGVVPLEWCAIHNSRWDKGGCLNAWVNQDHARCRREVKVKHWVTEETT